jgi:hypothetical protein
VSTKLVIVIDLDRLRIARPDADIRERLGDALEGATNAYLSGVEDVCTAGRAKVGMIKVAETEDSVVSDKLGPDSPCGCGHPWKRHAQVGCMVRPLSTNAYCPCVAVPPDPDWYDKAGGSFEVT